MVNVRRSKDVRKLPIPTVGEESSATVYLNIGSEIITILVSGTTHKSEMRKRFELVYEKVEEVQLFKIRTQVYHHQIEAITRNVCSASMCEIRGVMP